MKKQAKQLKKGDKLIIGSETLVVESLELSGVGKQGTQKVRVEAKKSSGEKVVLIRPADYPIETS